MSGTQFSSADYPNIAAELAIRAGNSRGPSPSRGLANLDNLTASTPRGFKTAKFGDGEKPSTIEPSSSTDTQKIITRSGLGGVEFG